MYIRGYIYMYYIYFVVWYFRTKGKTRATPTEPNQPSEALAHFMFELAKSLLSKAGGSSSTSVMFTQVCDGAVYTVCGCNLNITSPANWRFIEVIGVYAYDWSYTTYCIEEEVFSGIGVKLLTKKRTSFVLWCLSPWDLSQLSAMYSQTPKIARFLIFLMRMQPHGHMLLRWNIETRVVTSYYNIGIWNMKLHLYYVLQSTSDFFALFTERSCSSDTDHTQTSTLVCLSSRTVRSRYK